MSFEPARAALVADFPLAAAAFTDVAGLALKLVILEQQTLVQFKLDGDASIDAADRADFRFLVQRDDDATPAFAALPSAGVAGDKSLNVNVALVALLMDVSFGRVALLQPGRYTVKLQALVAGANNLLINGTAALGAPAAISVMPMSNDALVATGSDVEHVGGSY